MLGAKTLWIQVLGLFFLFGLANMAAGHARVKVKRELMTSSEHVCPHPCICQLGEAFCDGSSLDAIPLGLPQGLTKLNLMDNWIKRIKKKHIGHLRNLKSLNMRRNYIENIDSGVFENMNHLQALTFRDNYLKRVNRQMFKGLNNLEFLSFRTNRLQTIENAFQDLHHLKLLSLGENKISQLSSHTFSGNGRLQYLDLHNNSITFINKNAFVNLHMLKYLILRDNPIKLVDLNFKKNFHLELLDFTNCKLQEMIQGLPMSIKDLRVAENNIRTLTPRDFKKTRKIRLLVLSENNLQYIYNDTFKPLKFLDELEISNNSLSVLPQKLPNTLRKLTCANNTLTHVHEDDFLGNVNIEHLSLRLNHIAKVDMNAFKGLVKLKTLDLSRNNIDILQPALFEKAQSLELLDLSYNPITAVEQSCFLGLDNLHILEMSSVEAGKNFQPAVFKDTRHLLYLDLSNSSNVARHLAENPYFLNYLSTVEDLNLMYNSLYSLPESFAKYLPNLRSLKLIGNPWHCDTSIYWMTKWLKNNSVNFFEADSIVCASPPELQGRRVDSLTLRELPTMAPPLANFIPTIEIIEINFHHNETFEAYRNINSHTKSTEAPTKPPKKRPNKKDPQKEISFEQSEDFVAKHPKPTLPSRRFGSSSTSGKLGPYKNTKPTQKTTTTAKLTTTTLRHTTEQRHTQTNKEKVSTQQVTLNTHSSSVALTPGAIQGSTINPTVLQQTTPVRSSVAPTQITPMQKGSQPSTYSSDAHTSTTQIISTSGSPASQLSQKITETEQTTSSTTTKQLSTTETYEPTTTLAQDNTTPTRHQSTQETSQTTLILTSKPASTKRENTEQESPETSTQTSLYTRASTSVLTPDMLHDISKPSSITQFASPTSSRTTESTTTMLQSTTVQTETSTKITSNTSPQQSTPTRFQSTTKSPVTPSTSKRSTESISMPSSPVKTSKSPKTTAVEHMGTIEPYETKHHIPDIHTYNKTHRVINKPQNETVTDDNEPTIAKITVRRFTQAPPRIYWATTARPPVTPKPSEQTLESDPEQDLLSETLIPYKETHHGNKNNMDNSKTYDIVVNPPIAPHNRPFGGNDPFRVNEPFHRIRHQGHRNHGNRGNRGHRGNRKHEKPHANKPFHGTQHWWSHSNAGPFSSLNQHKFSNVKHPSEIQPTVKTDSNNNIDTHDNMPGENLNNPGLSPTIGDNNKQITNTNVPNSVATENRKNKFPPNYTRGPRGDTRWNERHYESAPWSNSRSHNYAFSSGEVDGAGSISQEIDEPTSGENDFY